MNEPPLRRPPQIGLQAIGLLTIILAASFACYGGLVRGGDAWPIYVVLTCTAPVILLMLIAGGSELFQAIERWRADRSDRNG
jgi:hypothetical protein